MNVPTDYVCAICSAAIGASCVSVDGEATPHAWRVNTAELADKGAEWATPANQAKRWESEMRHAVRVTRKLLDNALTDPQAPPGLMEHCTKIAADAQAVIDLLRGRQMMEEIESGGRNGQ